MLLPTILSLTIVSLSGVGTQDVTPQPQPESLNASKAGLAWPNGDSIDIVQFQASDKLSWYYTWSVWPVDDEDLTIEFVPMFWGNKTVNDFVRNINSTLRRGGTNVTSVLGMNEPEQQGQSNLTPSEGVQLWKTHMEPLRSSGLRLGSPAVSSAPLGKTWLQDFLQECNGSCSVDFIALHWYGTDPDAFIAHLWDYWYTFNRTIWVTEWACHNFVDLDKQCSPEGVFEFMNKTQTFMDNSTFVERYAWFGAMKEFTGVNPDNALIDEDGGISSLGRQYIEWDTTKETTRSGIEPSKAPSSLYGAVVFSSLLALGVVIIMQQ